MLEMTAELEAGPELPGWSHERVLRDPRAISRCHTRWAVL